MQTLRLEDGEMPILGLGTWKLTGQECVRSVQQALSLGYTHIDTAQIYGNHAAVGTAIADREREDLWITSKVWRDQMSYEDAKAACDEILTELGIEYLDLLLIHWPNKDVDMHETLDALEELKQEGKIRNIGVSNFTKEHLEHVKDHDAKISVNQVEYHALLNQEVLRHYCEEHGIALTAYSPLAHGKLVDDSLLQEIGDAHDATPAQVAIRWLTQKGVAAIPKASSKQHLQDNLDSLQFTLSEDEMARIDQRDEHVRTCEPPFAEF